MSIEKEMTTVQYDEDTGDYYITSNLLEKAGFKPGDSVCWTEVSPGIWALTKAKVEDNEE